MEIALKENRQKIKNGNIYVYFTKKGFADFVATGRIREIPDSFYRPFTVEERIWLLRQIVPYCRQSFYRLLKKPLNQLSENLHLCVNGSSGYLLFNNIHNRTICLVLNESSILTTFWDYLQNLDEHQLYSGEETAAFIERLISQLKTGSF